MGIVEVVHKELCILVSLFCRFTEIRPGPLTILLDILSGEVQLPQSILCVLVSLFGGSSQVLYCFRHILRDIFSFQIQLSQTVGVPGIPLHRRLFIPGNGFVHSSLVLQKFPQGVLGEVISCVSRSPEPQFCLLVVGKDTHAIPPALAQLICGQGESSLPELLQHLHLLRLFRLWIIVFLQHLLGTLVGLRHLPARGPGLVHRILVLIDFISHAGIFEGKCAKLEPLRLPDDHVLDGFEFLLL